MEHFNKNFDRVAQLLPFSYGLLAYQFMNNEDKRKTKKKNLRKSLKNATATAMVCDSCAKTEHCNHETVAVSHAAASDLSRADHRRGDRQAELGAAVLRVWAAGGVRLEFVWARATVQLRAADPNVGELGQRGRLKERHRAGRCARPSKKSVLEVGVGGRPHQQRWGQRRRHLCE